MHRLHSLCLRALAAAGLWVVFVPAAAGAYEPRVPDGYFGVSAPELTVMARDGHASLPTHVSAIREAGLDFVRATVDWRQVEPVLGVGGIHLYDWSATDRLVRALASQGLELVPSAVGTPVWARALDALTCGTSPAIAELHAPSFGQFAGAIVKRYGPAGSFWSANPDLTPQPVRRVEVWNEPNWTGSWCPGPQPERFARVAVAAGRAIRAANPKVDVVLGGLVLTKEDIRFSGGGLRGMESGRFLGQMVAAEPQLADLLDQVAIHLYDPDPDLNVSLLGWFRGRLDAAGLGHAGLLVTEFGWHTKGGDDALSEEARAEAYTALIDQLPRTDCDIRGLAAHNWVSAETDPTDPEHWFGLFDVTSGALYPAGAAFRDAVALFQGRGPTPAPRTTIPVCGAPPPDQDGDGTPDEADDYPLDPSRDSGSGETPPKPPEREAPVRPPSVPERFFSIASAFMPASPEQRALHYDQMADLGVRSVRQSVEWDIVEPADGASPATRFAWTDTDRRVIAYAKRGIATSLAPLHDPAWLPNSPAAADARFAEFLTALARRYGSQGQVWAENRHLDAALAPRDYEIWEAANLDASAWDGSASAAEYAATYGTARAALKAVDPQARAIVSLIDGGQGETVVSFLRSMVAARPALRGGIDGIYVMAFGARTPANLDATVARVREALDETGNAAAKLRIGFGAPTAGPGAMSESARAAFIAEAASRLPRLDCGVDEAVLFSWTSAQASTGNSWDWFGVTALADGAPTQSAAEFADAARAFTGYGDAAAAREALHPCMREPLDRDGDGVADPADPAPLDPAERDPLGRPPDAPRIDAAPAAWVNSTSATFRYAVSSAASYHCRVDGAAWQPCGAERQVTGLSDGAHTFSVRAVDSLGLIGPAARHDWNVDTRKPATTIVSGPSGITPNDSVTFTLASDEAGSRFYCRLDAKSWALCPASVTFADLSEGSHTFEAVAVDRAGNADPSQEHRYFEVRTMPAAPNLEAIGLETQTPTFRFRAAHASSFQCRFDDAAFGSCSGAGEHSPAKPLPKGAHRFEVRGVGPTGKLGPVAGWSFTTNDTRAPETTIASGPPVVTDSTEAEFRLSSDEDGVVFWCKLDEGPWSRCEARPTFSGLAEGKHVLTAAAVDTAGLMDPTPARYEWTVAFDRLAPTLTLARASVRRNGKASVRFRSADDSGKVSTTCRLDRAVWRSCGSPFVTPRLRRRSHVVYVRAADDAGNVTTRRVRLRTKR